MIILAIINIVLLIVVSYVSYKLYYTKKLLKVERNSHYTTNVMIWTVDPMKQRDYDELHNHPWALKVIEKWIMWMIALKFQETLSYEKEEDFFRAQWAQTWYVLLLRQIQSIIRTIKANEEKKKQPQ